MLIYKKCFFGHRALEQKVNLTPNVIKIHSLPLLHANTHTHIPAQSEHTGFFITAHL